MRTNSSRDDLASSRTEGDGDVEKNSFSVRAGDRAREFHCVHGDHNPIRNQPLSVLDTESEPLFDGRCERNGQLSNGTLSLLAPRPCVGHLLPEHCDFHGDNPIASIADADTDTEMVDVILALFPVSLWSTRHPWHERRALAGRLAGRLEERPRSFCTAELAVPPLGIDQSDQAEPEAGDAGPEKPESTIV